jgi:hypothetical protein
MNLLFREIHLLRDQLAVLRNVAAADRLDLMPPALCKMEGSLERLESLEKVRAAILPAEDRRLFLI